MTAALEEFVLRGGKRLRPAFAYWGWRAVAPAGRGRRRRRAAAVLRAGAAARVRAGARRRHRRVRHPPRACRPCTGSSPTGTASGTGTARPNSSACRRRSCSATCRWSWADDIVTSADLPPDAHRRVQRVWADIRTEVLGGQYLDIVAEASGAEIGRVGDERQHLQDRLLHGVAAAAARRGGRRRPARRAGHLPRGRHRPRAWPSSCATTCSACSATRRSPASPPVTTCGRASAPCCSPRRSNAPTPRIPWRPSCLRTSIGTDLSDAAGARAVPGHRVGRRARRRRGAHRDRSPAQALAAARRRTDRRPRQGRSGRTRQIGVQPVRLRRMTTPTRLD